MNGERDLQVCFNRFCKRRCRNKGIAITIEPGLVDLELIALIDRS